MKKAPVLVIIPNISEKSFSVFSLKLKDKILSYSIEVPTFLLSYKHKNEKTVCAFLLLIPQFSLISCFFFLWGGT